MNWEDLFIYRDAHLYWRGSKKGRKNFATEPAGYNDAEGYRCVMVNYKKYRAHRIIWEMFNSPIPAGYEIDHINLTPSDNRIENLRLASRGENARNIPKTNGKHKYKGVEFTKWGTYHARIKYEGQPIFIGAFSTELEAVEAYNKKAIELHRDFARLNTVTATLEQTGEK